MAAPVSTSPPHSHMNVCVLQHSLVQGMDLMAAPRRQNPPCGSVTSTELAVTPQQPSPSPVPLCQGHPLWGHASCAMSRGLCEGTHVPTVGYKGCRSGVEHPISCSGALLGSCCRRERRNDIPVPERLFSLGRVLEMGSHGNRLRHSLTCKRPRRQLWGEDPGVTTSSLGGRSRPTPTLPGCLPRSAQTPRGQGLLHFFSFAAQNRKSQNIGLSLG